jgi:hypothetical protein
MHEILYLCQDLEIPLSIRIWWKYTWVYNYNFSKTYCQCSAGDQTNSAVRSKLPYIVQVVVVVVGGGGGQL